MDLAIVNWVATHLHTPFLDWLMPILTALGEFGLIWIVIAVILLARRKTRRWGIVCLVALGLMLISGEGILKHLIARPRPFTHLSELTLLIPPPSSFSFPSGHTTAGIAAATVLCFMDRRVGGWALALAVLIAFSRLYLSVHYLTDLLGGALLGVACAYAARLLCDRMLPRLKSQP